VAFLLALFVTTLIVSHAEIGRAAESPKAATQEKALKAQEPSVQLKEVKLAISGMV
jgi:hypothetical protein